jgi:putative AdoMet-dependent methyltransferase
MLNSDGFDLWSGDYDASVLRADERGLYPFAGYANVMSAVYETVIAASPASILDVGFGTAVLTARLYDAGIRISGVDFSPEMVKIASSKMPKADLSQWDFTRGIPPVLDGRTFDFIISTYALHHLPDDAKVGFIAALLGLLEAEGTILIGDVCFHTREDLLSCKADCGDEWDDDEFYFVFSELRERLHPACSLSFHPFSFCAGMIAIRKK